ncbi:hypothetical protein BG005_001840 [Podila minutissima]|nr:hypothetical protein BG005_001840 [Podila minutissima]
MDVDSNQQFEAAKVHLQKAILKRKDQGQTTKKSVNFKVGKDLVAVRYFESESPYHEHEYEDEDRRHQEEGDERERRARDELYDDRHGSGHHDQLNADFERWSLRQYNPNKSEFTMSYSVTRGLVDGDYWRSPMVLTILPTTVKCAVRSSEIAAQAYREATVPPVQYHSLDHIPLSPAEPDPETIPPGPPTRNIALWNSHATNASILLGSLQAISGFLSRSQLGHEPVGRFMSPMPMPMSMHPSQH